MSDLPPSYDYSQAIRQLFDLLIRQPRHQESYYLLKGDVASVQSFIFSVQTKNAAKTLKAKSFYIQALTELCVKFILDELGLAKEQVIFNGGAVFYLLIPQSQVSDNWFEDLQKKVALALLEIPHDPNINLAKVELNPGDKVGEKWEELSHALLLNELKPYPGLYQEVFAPFGFKADYNAKWKRFTDDFVKSKPRVSGFNLTNQGKTNQLFAKFGYALEKHTTSPTDTLDIQIKDTVLNKLPQWTEGIMTHYQEVAQKLEQKHQDDPEYHLPKDNNIIDFEAMSLFAERRTGTAKLAVLKMDIDNLGSYFRKQDKLENAQKLSTAFGWFFQTRLYDFLDITLAGSEDKYRENIYIIFSGGDDCFLVGAWDAVFAFALKVQQEFHEFQKSLRQALPGLSDSKDITLSAGLLMVDEHFPVTRFAELAEEAIDAAKTYQLPSEAKPSKNKVCIFGEVISWSDLDTVKELTNLLKQLVEEEKSRSILERVKKSAAGYENLQKKIEKGSLTELTHPNLT